MEIVVLSDTGKVRRNNEDAAAYDADAAVAVLSDGMGGLDAGEVASRLAVDSILDSLVATRERTEAKLLDAVTTANAQVRQAAREAELEMGTTVVVWMLSGRGQCFVAHVGDSRIYRIRERSLRRLTSDHSMVQQMIDDGVLSEAEAETSPHRNVITRALGLEDQVEVEARSWVYVPGDLFLLCSDGLTDMLVEAEIESTLNRLLESPDASLHDAAEALIASANDAGGHDNVSVLLIRPD